MIDTRRYYTAAEQWVDRILHWFAIATAVAAVAGLLMLALRHNDNLLSGSVLLYGLGLLGMLSCSALCNHDLSDRSRYTELFRRLDHAAILFMIAATYTPLALVLMGGVWGWGLFAFVWTVALTGIVIRLITRGPLRPAVSIALYLLLGWSILGVLEPLLAVAPLSVLVLLFCGGLLYSSGVLFFVWKRMPYHISIWHGFVLSAAGCHYAAILFAVVL
ncbi:MAG: hemolysin III family protein [Aquisalimonadaceae bacterium]